jgi:hypothetical protein
MLRRMRRVLDLLELALDAHLAIDDAVKREPQKRTGLGAQIIVADGLADFVAQICLAALDLRLRRLFFAIEHPSHVQEGFVRRAQHRPFALRLAAQTHDQRLHIGQKLAALAHQPLDPRDSIGIVSQLRRACVEMAGVDEDRGDVIEASDVTGMAGPGGTPRNPTRRARERSENKTARARLGP